MRAIVAGEFWSFPPPPSVFLLRDPRLPLSSISASANFRNILTILSIRQRSHTHDSRLRVHLISSPLRPFLLITSHRMRCVVVQSLFYPLLPNLRRRVVANTAFS